MKTFIKLLVLCMLLGTLGACTTNKQRQEKYNRKIYLTEEDYLEDLTTEAAKERREAPAQECRMVRETPIPDGRHQRTLCLEQG